MSIAATQVARANSVVMRARGLSKRFGGQQVLSELDLDLHAGEVVLLRGENGSGKTTLLNILTGSLEPDAGVVEVLANSAEECFRFPRNWWQDLNPFDHFTPERLGREGVGRLWQEVRLFQTRSLVDNVAVARQGQAGENPGRALFSARQVWVEERRNRSAAVASLSRLGLGERLEATAERISLGQSKRVAILRALQAGARIVFLDEPLAGLDAEGIETVMDLILTLARERQVATVIVEHAFNIPRLLLVADRVWTLQDGRLHIQIPRAVAASPTNDPTSRYQDILRASTGRSAQVALQALPGGATLTVMRPPPDTKSTSVAIPALRVDGAVVQRGVRRVIGWRSASSDVIGLDLQIRAGDLAILQAPNGWGKTTLALVLAGIIPLQEGCITLQGQRVEGIPAWRRARLGLLTYLGADRRMARLKVSEYLRLGPCGTLPPDLAPLRHRQLSALSGGERSRVALHALGCRPYGVRILDEPFSSLSAAASLAVAQQLFASPGASANLILEPAAHPFAFS